MVNGHTSERNITIRKNGFTIVELLIVVVVIAILAAIAVVSYNGISGRAKEASLKSDLKSGATQLEVTKTNDGVYPGDASNLKKSDNTTFTYSSVGGAYCLVATSSGLPGQSFYVTDTSAIQQGTCPTASIQTVTAAGCPSSQTLVRDVRDNHTYWVQKLADGMCWMLTNLGYAGGGSNMYGDVRTLSDGTSDGSTTYTVAKYYVVPSTTNYTTDPTAPSIATNGTGQYGYLYNWCAAMGNQQGTNACLDALTPVKDPVISICPAGWRLPTGGSGGELSALNTAVNSGSTVTDTGLRTGWLGQWSGIWLGSFVFLGSEGYYWSSSQSISSTSANALAFNSSSVSTTGSASKTRGYGVRCVAL